MNYEEKKRWKLRILVPAVILAVIFGLLIFAVCLPDSFYGITKMNNGWKLIEISNERMDAQNVSLPIDKLSFHNVQAYILEKELNEEFERPQTLCIKNNFMLLRIYLDDQPLYGKARDEEVFLDKIAIHSRYMIDIPPGSNGKSLKLEFRSADSNFTGKLDQVICGEQQNILGYVLLKGTLIKILIDIINMYLGVQLIITYLFFHNKMEAKSLVYIGICLMMVGAWAMSMESGVLSFNPYTYISSYYITVGLSCCIPMFFFLGIRETMPELIKKKAKFLIYAYILNILYLCFANIFFESVILKLTVPIMTNVVLVIINAGALLLWSIKQVKENRKSKNREEGNSIGVDNIFVFIVLAGMIVWPLMSFSMMLLVLQIGSVIYGMRIAYRNGRQVLEESQRTKRLQAEALELRNQVVLNQIQPSFMVHTLEMVQKLIQEDPDKAYDLVYDFANFLRYNVDNVDTGNYKLFKDELQNIRNFFYIESIRLGDKLKVDYDIQVLNVQIPTLSIQLLAEWAVLRSEEKMAENIHIVIRSYEEGEQYFIEIEENNGVFSQLEYAETEILAEHLSQVCQRWLFFTGYSIKTKEVLGNGSCISAGINPNHSSRGQNIGGIYENNISGR